MEDWDVGLRTFCVDKLLGSIMCCIACIAFVYTGSLRQIKTECTHFRLK